MGSSFFSPLFLLCASATTPPANSDANPSIPNPPVARNTMNPLMIDIMPTTLLLLTANAITSITIYVSRPTPACRYIELARSCCSMVGLELLTVTNAPPIVRNIPSIEPMRIIV
ncbi:MAG TPA: hypothetical protein VFT83_02040 [Nitrososphaeraceae archaeon]|nr:hypothetical protein [Nitrososphaeraceae archaeon]